MKDRTVLLLLIVAFFLACEKEAVIDHSDEVGIQVENLLSIQIDTFQFYFDTSLGTDSILITQLGPDELSDLSYFDDANYYYKETEDIFLIKQGRFVIESKSYYIANCFCEPELKEGQFSEGKLIIQINGIDELRGEVIYEIIKE